MFEENQEVRLFIKTTKQVIKELEEIKEIEIDKFEDAVIDAFDRYNVDGIEDLVGFDSWEKPLSNKKHILNIKVDHEDAYEFSIHIDVNNSKVSVTNVL